jgi:diphosphomevalonate decarboxylase
MHAAAMAARPGIVFFKGPTMDALHLVRDLRKKGLLAYFTCDAGPQPKILCSKEHQGAIAKALGDLPGISRVIPCHLGEGARVIEAP